MTFWSKVQQYRTAITIILAASGIGAMVLYATCDTSCSSLKGDIFGIDLKFIGPGYMIAIIILTLTSQIEYVRILLSAGIGVEVYLFAFQVREDIFCQYCLAFAAAVILMFAVQYKLPSQEGGVLKRLLYAFGSCEIPLLGIKNLPLVILVILGYLAIDLTFNGGVIPLYGT